jgi:hypothetical protein
MLTRMSDRFSIEAKSRKVRASSRDILQLERIIS